MLLVFNKKNNSCYALNEKVLGFHFKRIKYVFKNNIFNNSGEKE